MIHGFVSLYHVLDKGKQALAQSAAALQKSFGS
jgi:hypothetical protein